MTLQSGTLLKGRYLIEGQLGKGGMGAVYLAQDQALRIKVAVKENLNVNPESERQFRREAELLAALRHPNLPRVSDHFILEERQYLVMDYIAGEDLQARSDRQPPSVEEVLEWADAVCNALSYLHSREPPIIHRDIKPTNVKLQPDGTVVLVDFGIAKEFDQAVTTTGARGLTPGFSPPEQYGAQRTDARSDQFSLSATIYCLLTGQRPADSIERSIKKADLIPPSTLNPSVPTYVDSALSRALALEKEARFHDIATFRAALKDEIQPATVLEAILPVASPSLDEVKTVLEPSAPSASADIREAPHGVQEPVLPTAQTRRRWGRILGIVVLGVAIVGGVTAIAVRGGFLSLQPEPVGDYIVVTDNYGVLELEIPTGWNDIDGTPWYFDDELVGASIWASPDLDGFTNTWSTPGVILDVSDEITEWVGTIELLDIHRADMLDYCELDGRYDYEDALYLGKYDLYYECGGSDGPWYMVLAAVSETEEVSSLILFEAQIVNEEDWDIAQHVLDTFVVVGELP